MPTLMTFPNGDTLQSSALAPREIQALLQTLTGQMLGIDPTSDPEAYSKVRLDWPTSGQPSWGVGEDVCFLRASEEDDNYNRVRDQRYTPSGVPEKVNTLTHYTRVWRILWSFYGPNSFDQARLLKSALLQLEFPHETLAAANLYLVSDIPASTRSPELFQGQWWERTDLAVILNEGVTESFTVATIASAEVLLEAESGLVADLTI